MKLINPYEISARILTLLDESEERVILVSPYMKISKWYKMQNKINELIYRGIHTEIYIRDDPDNTATYRDLENTGLQYKMISLLHSKFYLNERIGIVTSMNLLLSSEINSLEIAYETETWNEYNNLYGNFNRYIRAGDPVQSKTIKGRTVADPSITKKKIREELNRVGINAWLWFTENKLHVSTGGNTYIISIIEDYLRINAKLRTKTGFKSTDPISQKTKKIADLTGINVMIHAVPGTKTMELSGQGHNRLESTCITTIMESEADIITEQVISFIRAAENLV